MQLVLAALMTLAIGCFAVPAQLAAQHYDSAPRCAAATQGPDCVAFVPVTAVGQDALHEPCSVARSVGASGW